MKKPNRRDHPDENVKGHGKERAKEGRWEFAATQSLFSLGSTEQAHRVAYRTATGELRFLPR
jgi:hypothetical protein